MCELGDAAHLDRDNGVLLDKRVVKLGELSTGQPLGLVRVLVLEAVESRPHQPLSLRAAFGHPGRHSLQVVLAVLVELGRGDVEGDRDLALVTGRLDGLHQELERLLGTRDVGGETTLVTDVGGYKFRRRKRISRTPRSSSGPDSGRTVNSVLLVDDLLEVVVSLGTHLHGLGERLGAGGQDHELLESQGVSGVGSSVDHVEARDGQGVRSLDTGELSQVLVQGDTLLGGTGLGDGHRDTEDGIGTQLALVGGSVELDEEVIDLLLLGDFETALDQGLGDDVVDVRDSLGDTLAHVGRLVTVPELDGLVDTGGSTRGDLGCEQRPSSVGGPLNWKIAPWPLTSEKT